ncbi:hypothetical protein [Stella sp.]|uniref:hypothetical protein n=1 Tax=Stella sp. TaxID=2912054 RepID=UPI0035B0073A
MPLLLRHLMPLIVIGAFFLFSLLCTLAVIAALGRMFGRRPTEIGRGPVIEGEATQVPAEPAARDPQARR